jgi:hypothetical protein
MPAPRRLASSPGGRSRRRPGLADVRIRSKLGLILVIPVLAIATLAALRLGDASRQAEDASLVGALTVLSARASAVAHELHRERMAAAAALAAPATPIDAFRKQVGRSDAAIDAYRTARTDLETVPATVRDRLQRIDVQFGTLPALRDAVAARQRVAVSEVVLRYGLIVTELVSYRESLSQATGDTELANSLIAAAAFSKAKLLVGTQEAIIFAALSSGALDGQQYSAFIATLTGQQEALVAFSLAATPAQRGLVEATIAGDAVQLADDITADLRRSVDGITRVTAAEASSSLGAVNDLMRGAEQRIDADLLTLTTAKIEDVRQQVLLEAAIIVIVLALLIGLTVAIARSMARTLRRLRDGALLVAHHQLGEAVERLRDTEAIGERTPADIAAQVPDAIGIDTRDEIGDVARAFDVVHREAVRTAAEQAALRASVSAMFLNLARRSQSLVDRMIGQLDGIEREEEDPRRLAQLFKLDHLATRMRRNDENVLVLAGADTAPPRRENAPLADVAQAAQSEVELYERIEFGAIDEEISIAAHAVNDVVRLLAELLDNATRFSPPTTTVSVVGHRVGESAHVRVEDRGLGMTPEDAAAHNARFAAPPTIDATTFRMMGLAVVSRLAYRHAIRVHMSENPGGGTVVELTLPPNVVVLPLMRQLPAAPTVHSTNGTGMPTSPPTDWPAFPVTRSAGLPVRRPAAPHAPAPHAPAPVGGAPAVHPTFLRSTSDRWAALFPDPAARPPRPVDPDDTAEMPIFREIQASWFRHHGDSTSGGWPLVKPAGPPAREPEPVRAAASTPNRAQAYSQAPTQTRGHAPDPSPEAPPDTDDIWRTRADAGWRAAAAASSPPVKDRTRSGLPKRQPHAQLVPGAVSGRPATRSARNPEETRGRLSAYHRGVQRGRATTAAQSTNTTEGNLT